MGVSEEQAEKEESRPGSADELVEPRPRPDELMGADGIYHDEEGAEERYFGLTDLDSFKKNFIEGNRGKPIILIRFERIEGLDLLDFLNNLKNEVHKVLDLDGVEFGFHFIDSVGCLLMGVTPLHEWTVTTVPNVDSAIGRYHDECVKSRDCLFDFGVARTQCNYISNIDEIFEELYDSAHQNLKDNLVRWSWTYFNRAYTYISGKENVVIQPTLYYDAKAKTFGVKGGEVFVGGGNYETYRDLIADIPDNREMRRVELLVLEKLVSGCERAPGLLKFNISPQTLIDTFSDHEKVNRMHRLIHSRGLNPTNVRIELIEKPYDERERSLTEVCQDFWNYGISFAADDFGVRSQSHQVILTLGIMIKEFKLDPISFKFKADEDRIKFLDNLAFIEYCKRLADNRLASITAEAVEDYETLQFLMEHQVSQFQANMFCGKIPVPEYIENFEKMQGLSEEVAMEIFQDPELFARQRERGNIFQLARELGKF